MAPFLIRADGVVVTREKPPVRSVEVASRNFLWSRPPLLEKEGNALDSSLFLPSGSLRLHCARHLVSPILMRTVRHACRKSRTWGKCHDEWLQDGCSLRGADVAGGPVGVHTTERSKRRRQFTVAKDERTDDRSWASAQDRFR